MTLAVHALRDEPDLFDVGVQLEAALAAERAADAGILAAVGVSVLVASANTIGARLPGSTYFSCIPVNALSANQRGSQPASRTFQNTLSAFASKPPTTS